MSLVGKIVAYIYEQHVQSSSDEVKRTMKIVIGGNFPSGAIELFQKELPKEYDVDIITDPQELGQRTDVEILITRGFDITRSFIEKNTKLKLIQKWGSGLNAVDVKAAGEHGIPVCNVPGANAYAVSELTILLMLAVYRNLLYHSAKAKAGIWSKSDLVERTYCLRGKTVGIVGCGHIGRLVARKVQAFDAETIYYDAARMSPEEEKTHGMKFARLDELLRVSDVVTLHIPLMDSTKNFISKRELALMKPTAVLINAARGGLVNEQDLLQALDQNRLLGAGLDCLVHEKDQLSAEDPILRNEKITVTPHIGGTSNDIAQAMVPRMAANVVRFVKGEPLLSVANREYLV